MDGAKYKMKRTFRVAVRWSRPPPAPPPSQPVNPLGHFPQTVEALGTAPKATRRTPITLASLAERFTLCRLFAQGRAQQTGANARSSSLER